MTVPKPKTTERAGAGEAALVWLRNDLRLRDNPALAAAAERPLLCLYIVEEPAAARLLGAASRWWLGRSLRAFSDALAERGGRLLLLRGDPRALVPEVAAAIGAGLVTWNRRYEPQAIECDRRIKTALMEGGCAVRSFNAALLAEPWEVMTRSGGPFKVFTPYWRAARARDEPPRPLDAPQRLASCDIPRSLAQRAVAIEALGYEPTAPDWAGGLRAAWQPGEAGALERLDDFLGGALAGYAEGRDRPDRLSTSRLSPHLRFGEIGPRQIWHATRTAIETGEAAGSRGDAQKFLTEIGWREFSYQLLFHFPDLATRNFDARFDAFPWRRAKADLAAWRQGRTGIPFVDAGLRELWATGFMHNRVRMVAASFLIKHLLLDWRSGEAWFWDTLVDADPANNSASWQWVAGSGADAAPYFRIFNPVTQGTKFDPDGSYVRQWVPELARLDARHIHAPWLAPAAVLAEAGVTLGQSYPKPIVDLDEGRERALAGLKRMRDDTQEAAEA